ncbi:MAG: hypothetical protein HC904_10575 [Blastochloris sp.]|nr:hypothetical protein [Blastochloris sp.]
MDQKQFRLSAITAEFDFSATERDFQDHQWKDRSGQNLWIAWIWIAGVLAVWLWTGLSQPNIHGLWSLMANLFAGACLLLASQPKKFYIHYDLVFCLILILLLAGMTQVVITAKPNNPLWISLFVTIPLLTNIALQVRAGYAWLVTAFGIVLFHRLIRAQDLDSDLREMLMLQMLISSGVGIVIHRLLAISRRLEYAKWKTEKI